MKFKVFGEGGLITRLSFLAALAGAAPLHAHENLFQAMMDLDYDRQFRLSPDAPPFLRDPIPGYAAYADTAASHAALAARFTSDYSNLIRKTGPFGFEHENSLSHLRIGSGILPGLILKADGEASRRNMNIGDSTKRVDGSGSAWDWNGSMEYAVTPEFVPTVVVGGNTDASRENALLALAFHGNFSIGGGDASESLYEKGAHLSWSASIGKKNLDFPLQATVPDYAPLELPLLLRRNFAALSCGLQWSNVEVTWGGRYFEMDRPTIQPAQYILSDSGIAWDQSFGAAYARGSVAHSLRASLEADLSYGHHFFLGTSQRTSSLYRFSFEETKQMSYALRGDVRAVRGPWESGWFIGGSELEWQAVRPSPEMAFDHHFWDRNGVLDSYQGSLLGVFSSETWLFNGDAYLGQWGSGLWAARNLAGWRGQAGLTYQHLDFRTNSHLTQRKTEFILAVQEDNTDRVYPEAVADLVTPELRLTKNFGPAFVEATVSQALPVHVELLRYHNDGTPATGGSSGTGPSDSEYSGGTTARVEIGFRLR